MVQVILPILKDRLDDAYHAATDNTAGAALRAQLREVCFLCLVCSSCEPPEWDWQRAARDREQQQAQEGAVQQAGIQQQLDRTLGSLKQLCVLTARTTRVTVCDCRFLRIYPMLHMLWEAATLM